MFTNKKKWKSVISALVFLQNKLSMRECHSGLHYSTIGRASSQKQSSQQSSVVK